MECEMGAGETLLIQQAGAQLVQKGMLGQLQR